MTRNVFITLTCDRCKDRIPGEYTSDFGGGVRVALGTSEVEADLCTACLDETHAFLEPILKNGLSTFRQAGSKRQRASATEKEECPECGKLFKAGNGLSLHQSLKHRDRTSTA